MPIPFIIAGMAIAAAGYGAKKGYDAKCDYDEADNVNTEAEVIYDKAVVKLERERKNTQKEMEELGILKFNIYENSIIPFVDEFTKIKNIPNSINIDGNEVRLPNSETINEMQMKNLELKEVVSGSVAALGTGGLVGLAAYGGVGSLATASTGTAIAGLSGAAATNATLAWIGGGSLASGGFGIAGGTAILGGIVAGPVLAIGGMMIASKAEEAKHDAYSNLETAKIAVEEMKSAKTKTKGISKKVKELSIILSNLDNRLKPCISFLQELTKKDTNFKNYSKEELSNLKISYHLYETLVNLLDVHFLTKKWEYNK